MEGQITQIKPLNNIYLFIYLFMMCRNHNPKKM